MVEEERDYQKEINLFLNSPVMAYGELELDECSYK